MSAYNVLRTEYRQAEAEELSAYRKADKVKPKTVIDLSHDCAFVSVLYEPDFVNAGLDPLPVGVEPPALKE